MNRRQFTSLPGGLPMLGFANWSGASGTPEPLEKYVRTNWSRDPFSYGAYSYLAKGSGNKDRVILSTPVNNQIFFAGEALNPNYQSSTHAAYESGVNTSELVANTKHQRIAVIGAGISGMTAAKKLAEQDRKVTVFEGRKRTGGRILSDRSLGATVDLGATWIHSPDGNPISSLADQAKMPRVETDDEYVIRGANGKKIWSLLAPDWLYTVQAMTPTGTDMNQINMEETQQQFDQFGYGYKGRDVKFPNGYDEILGTLAGDYDIQLDTKITGIKYSANGVDVISESGVLASFEAVIITVPLGVLKENIISFSPALPAEKQAAIERMGMGTLDKLYLRFKAPFWDNDATTILTPNTGLPQGQFNYWINFHKYLGEPIIMGFNAGSAALILSGDSDDEFIAKALNTLASAYPA